MRRAAFFCLLWVLLVIGGASGQKARPYAALKVEGKYRWITYMAFSDDGKVFAASHCYSHGPSFVTLWEAASGKLLRKVDGPANTLNFNPVALSPDGKLLAVGGIAEIRLVDGQSGKLLHKMKDHSDVHHLAFSPDGKALASCGRGKEVILWDVKTGKKTATFRHDRPIVFSVAFSPDGKQLAALGFTVEEGTTSDWQVQVWNVVTSKPVSLTKGKAGEAFDYASLSSDGKVLILRKASRLQLWDTASGKLRSAVDVPGEEGELGFAFSGDNKSLLTVGYQKETGKSSGRLDRWDIATGKNLGSTKLPEDIGSNFLIPPRGEAIAFRDGESTIQLWRAKELLPSVKKK